MRLLQQWPLAAQTAMHSLWPYSPSLIGGGGVGEGRGGGGVGEGGGGRGDGGKGEGGLK